LSIDLDSTEGRKQYLSEKLDDLLEGINDSYGTLLMEELLARLELTVKDFNDEMKVLCDQLVTKEKERQQLMEMLKTTDGLPTPASGGAPAAQDASQTVETAFVETEELGEDVPEWEKKLAKLEKK
jgi:chromosome segregation ATPase